MASPAPDALRGRDATRARRACTRTRALFAATLLGGGVLAVLGCGQSETRDAGPADAGVDAGARDAGAPVDAGHSCDAAATPRPGPDYFACHYDLWCRSGSEVCCSGQLPGWECVHRECRPRDDLTDCGFASECTSPSGGSPCPGAGVCCYTIGRLLCEPSLAACQARGGDLQCSGPGDCPPELPHCGPDPMDLEAHDICQVPPR
jgi:hypothetical protein